MPWDVPDLWGEELLEVALNSEREERKDRNSIEGLGEGHRLTGTLSPFPVGRRFGG